MPLLGRAWRLWAARGSQGERPGHWAPRSNEAGLGGGSLRRRRPHGLADPAEAAGRSPSCHPSPLQEALFLVLFGLFFGPVFSVWTVLLPELLPPRDRAKLIGWLMALPFVFAFLVVSTFPLLDHNSTRIAFAVYAALAAALAALFYFLLPETLGLSFDSV